MRSPTLLALFVSIFVSACSKQDAASPQNQFTLQSGVSLVNASACMEEPKYSLGLEKDGPSYLVYATGRASCSSEAVAPYMTVVSDGRATLVLNPPQSKSSCECFRTFEARVVNRIHAGDILYVLTGGEVLGHVKVP